MDVGHLPDTPVPFVPLTVVTVNATPSGSTYYITPQQNGQWLRFNVACLIMLPDAWRCPIGMTVTMSNILSSGTPTFLPSGSDLVEYYLANTDTWGISGIELGILNHASVTLTCVSRTTWAANSNGLYEA